eukprot:gnl/TRDRNA2_/TRDRNA2_175952_c13_seq30.p1 gnl/TRDRNA2_/TRDRNA2_175952_c13~~gnl/TRDRNA2_/TRDRNA2_175952_c13_seq30.p1  ORF type:complete len:394 (+),score=28.92 gnl/TRDRNA2_/TRDRNA2_175952_c13_seq30:178-1182(+)
MESMPVSKQYLTSLSWALCLFTPASIVQGVFPCNNFERIYAIVFLVLGLGMFMSLIGNISSNWTLLRHLKQDIHQQKKLLQRFFHERNISRQTQQRITFFVQHTRLQKPRIHEEQIKLFQGLPMSLKKILRWEMYQASLLSHPLFFAHQDQDVQLLRDICSKHLREKRLLHHQDRFCFGEMASEMMFVTSGHLQYFLGPLTDGTPVLVESTTFVCEMVLWIKWFHRGKLLSQESVELLELNGSDFHSMIKHRAASFRRYRTYGQLYVEALLREICETGLETLTDLYGSPDLLRELAYQASNADQIVSFGKVMTGGVADLRGSQSPQGLQAKRRG